MIIAWIRYWWWRNWNNDIYPRWKEVVIEWFPDVNTAKEMRVGFKFPDGTIRGKHPSRYW